MVELRKRKTPPPAPAKPAKKEKKPKEEPAANGAGAKEKATEVKKAAPAAATAKKSGPPKVGDKIDLESFGGQFETNDGEKTSLKQLVEKSKSGVVIFTYPKASTGGCTKQAVAFRDSYEPLTSTGLDIYGLSRDSTTSNTNFKTKQNLPYTLLCDKPAALVGALGFKNGESTQRGIFVVSKDGEVLALEAGSPLGTVDVVKAIVDKLGGTDEKGEEQLDKAEENAAAAEETDADKENGAKL
ncbi:thioredoxin-like protein [Elsinoe ampelina]|uniref:thioredoxin-dependent peroxiredoxin n=1 Tax=Elsinoe ampelina TaxID=302913 RepID=A0A6A6GCS0_9PEZI|nr:thioredoxin-like protein [Elsinoe ampelina]